MTIAARLTPDLIRAIFAEAASLEFGIRLPIEAVHQARATTMISQTMPANEQIMVCAFPEAGELWFVKRTVEVII